MVGQHRERPVAENFLVTIHRAASGHQHHRGKWTRARGNRQGSGQIDAGLHFPEDNVLLVVGNRWLIASLSGACDPKRDGGNADHSQTQREEGLHERSKGGWLR
jgi:hypothetical protein